MSTAYRKVTSRVRAIHQERRKPIDGVPAHHRYCSEDGQTWPCKTITTLDELEEELEQYEQANAEGAARHEEIF